MIFDRGNGVAPDTGLVTAKQPGGQATVRATAHNGKYAECAVTTATAVDTIDIGLPNGSQMVYKGETVQLEAVLAPLSASDKDISLALGGTKYASMGAKTYAEEALPGGGATVSLWRFPVTGKNPGSVSVTAAAKDGADAAHLPDPAGGRDADLREKHRPEDGAFDGRQRGGADLGARRQQQGGHPVERRRHGRQEVRHGHHHGHHQERHSQYLRHRRRAPRAVRRAARRAWASPEETTHSTAGALRDAGAPGLFLPF